MSTVKAANPSMNLKSQSIPGLFHPRTFRFEEIRFAFPSARKVFRAARVLECRQNLRESQSHAVQVSVILCKTLETRQNSSALWIAIDLKAADV
jgi:hypothetical protein